MYYWVTSLIGYINAHNKTMGLVVFLTCVGFTKTHQACCGIGKYGGFLNCFQGFPVCKDVYNHLFWDAYHPSSKFCKQLIEILWNNGPPYSYPKSGKELLL